MPCAKSSWSLPVSKLLFLDFDETLFNHQAMLEWMDEMWQEHYGSEPAIFANTIDQYHTHVSEGHRLYRHREHFELSGKPWQAVSGHMTQLIQEQKQDFCYPEVHEAVERLAQKHETMAILTFGDVEYQNYKINHCRLLARLKLPVHVVSESKRLFLAREFAKQPGILVDDKYPLNLPSHWAHVWLNRDSKLKVPKRLNVTMWQISTLTQLPEVVQQIETI